MELKKKNRLTLILFVIYLVILTWIIVFKMQFTLADLGYYRKINLIPFQGSVIVNNRLDMSEIIMNVLAFVPLGIYLSMLEPRESFIRKLLPVFFVSLTYEVMQYVLGVGASDITDLITNTSGGAVGIVVFYCFEKGFKEKAVKILNILALCGTVLLIIFIGILVIANL